MKTTGKIWLFETCFFVSSMSQDFLEYNTYVVQPVAGISIPFTLISPTVSLTVSLDSYPSSHCPDPVPVFRIP